jgi:hypothetical protein
MEDRQTALTWTNARGIDEQPAGRFAWRQLSSIRDDEQMGSTPSGDTNPADAARFVAPRNFEIDRGNQGRVSVCGCP